MRNSISNWCLCTATSSQPGACAPLSNGERGSARTFSPALRGCHRLRLRNALQSIKGTNKEPPALCRGQRNWGTPALCRGQRNWGTALRSGTLQNANQLRSAALPPRAAGRASPATKSLDLIGSATVALNRESSLVWRVRIRVAAPPRNTMLAHWQPGTHTGCLALVVKVGGFATLRPEGILGNFRRPTADTM